MPGPEFWFSVGLIVSLVLFVSGYEVSFLLKGKTATETPSLSEVADELILLNRTGFTRQGTYVGDEEFRATLLFWPDVCIDSTFYALDALRCLLAGGADDDRHRLCALIRERSASLVELLQTHFDDGEGAFSHHLRSWPSLYASAMAVQLCRWVADPDSFVAVHEYGCESQVDAVTLCVGRRAVNKLVSFVRRCELEEGGFAEFPGGQPTMVSTEAGYRLLEMLGEGPRFARSTANFIWQSCKLDASDCEGHYGLGFGNQPSYDQPSCSGTRFAARLLAHDEFKAFRALSDQHKAHIIDFLLALRDRDGGFGMFEGAPSCVVQTSLAFATLRSLAPPWCRFEEVVPCDSVAPYLEVLNRPEYRFGFRPGSPPNIYATRAVARLVLLMKMVYPGLRLDDGLRRRTVDAVYQHLDERTGLFVGYAHDRPPSPAATPWDFPNSSRAN